VIDKIITDIIDQEAPDQTVAVLMSGGTDSLTVAIAAHRLNKTLNCYTFRVDGKDSEDSIYAKKACEHFGWNFKLIDVPVDNIENDFFTLIKKYECKKKTHVECTFPFLYVYPHIKEKHILTGWAADGYYGVSKRANIHYKHTKELFDVFRNGYFGKLDKESQKFTPGNPVGVKQQMLLAETIDSTLVAPYIDIRVWDWMIQYDWDFFNKPYQKAPLFNAFPELLEIKRRNHLNLQLAAGIPNYFEKLLDNKEINIYNRSRIMDLVRDWNNTTTSIEGFFV
jgi:asparagine synthetase B (glutamine-hydrolysing)